MNRQNGTPGGHPAGNSLIYIYAEYCPIDPDRGWWIYAAPIVEGNALRSQAPLGREHGWLHTPKDLALVWEALRLSKFDRKEWKQAEYTAEFLQSYPQGAVVIAEYGLRKLDLIDRPIIDKWRLLRDVREQHLLEWEAADTDYLEKVKSRMAEHKHNWEQAGRVSKQLSKRQEKRRKRQGRGSAK